MAGQQFGGKERTYQGLPSREVDVEVLNPGCIGRCVTLQQHHCVLSLEVDVSQRKHIAAAAVVALQNGIAKNTVLVQLDLLDFGFDLWSEKILMALRMRERGESTQGMMRDSARTVHNEGLKRCHGSLQGT